MNRMTNNDKNWGPFTLARWKKEFSIALYSGDDEDPESAFRIIAFGWALRCRVPVWMCPPIRKKVQANWDEATVKRLGRNYYFDITERRFGFALSDMGNGYDFLQVFYGANTFDSSVVVQFESRLAKSWR